VLQSVPCRQGVPNVNVEAIASFVWQAPGRCRPFVWQSAAHPDVSDSSRGPKGPPGSEGYRAPHHIADNCLNAWPHAEVNAMGHEVGTILSPLLAARSRSLRAPGQKSPDFAFGRLRHGRRPGFQILLGWSLGPSQLLEWYSFTPLKHTTLTLELGAPWSYAPPWWACRAPTYLVRCCHAVRRRRCGPEGPSTRLQTCMEG
jgi:hypothetical protein